MEERPFSDISYGKFLNEEKLMGSKCKNCGEMFVPPRKFCLSCHGSDMEWHEMSGLGELAAFTCIFVAPPHMVSQGYTRDNPYCSGVVRLEDGPRTVARIEGVDAAKPDEIKVGMPLEVAFIHSGEGDDTVTTLAFKPRS